MWSTGFQQVQKNQLFSGSESADSPRFHKWSNGHRRSESRFGATSAGSGSEGLNVLKTGSSGILSVAEAFIKGAHFPQTCSEVLLLWQTQRSLLWLWRSCLDVSPRLQRALLSCCVIHKLGDQNTYKHLPGLLLRQEWCWRVTLRPNPGNSGPVRSGKEWCGTVQFLLASVSTPLRSSSSFLVFFCLYFCTWCRTKKRRVEP